MTDPMAAASLNAGMMTVTDDGSGGMAEVDHVAILHDVLLAFKANLRIFAAGGERTAPEQRPAGHHLRADEAALNIAVDLACSQLGAGAARNRPCAVFVFAHGKE